ncbi:hypothetical protein PSPO01_14585 [Paraphaeosphaeria sporulosa]
MAPRKPCPPAVARPARTRSVPASFNYRTPTPRVAPPRPGWLHRIAKVRVTVGAAMHAQRRNVVRGLAVLACAYVARNLRAWATQEPSPLVTRWRQHPQWMHTSSSYAVLGLHPPLDPSWVPPYRIVRVAMRKQSAKWHPDNYRENGVDQATARRIWSVFASVLDHFDNFYRNPASMRARWGNHGGLLNPVDTGLPHWNNKTEGAFEALWALFVEMVHAGATPPHRQAKAPQTEAEAALYHPRTWRHVIEGLNPRRSPIPPLGIARYYTCFNNSPSYHPIIVFRRFLSMFALVPTMWSEEEKERWADWLLDVDLAPYHPMWQRFLCGWSMHDE